MLSAFRPTPKICMCPPVSATDQLTSSRSFDERGDLAIANMYAASRRLLFPCPFCPSNRVSPGRNSSSVFVWFLKPARESLDKKMRVSFLNPVRFSVWSIISYLYPMRGEF